MALRREDMEEIPGVGLGGWGDDAMDVYGERSVVPGTLTLGLAPSSLEKDRCCINCQMEREGGGKWGRVGY